MVTLSSTLIETVSLNYEDFNESFLTCGTCLYTYDGDIHSPKLLPCSHTICKTCLEQIVQNAMRRQLPPEEPSTSSGPQSTTFRCPICRENIALPRGGVCALRPNFLVNQLLDLMAQQRREVVPKCSTHTSRELLFCESCDAVFCSECSKDTHRQVPGEVNGEPEKAHTVIPFSIAIKRMSEILLYKAQEMLTKLNDASHIVSQEIDLLDHNMEAIEEEVEEVFDHLLNAVKARKEEILEALRAMGQQKKSVLEAQLNAIEQERGRVNEEVEKSQQLMDVCNITKKIIELSERSDAYSDMADPKENSYLSFDRDVSKTMVAMETILRDFGSVKSSNTFPPLCTVDIPSVTYHLSCTATLETVDILGNPRTCGSDPVEAKLVNENQNETSPVCLKDYEDGKYGMTFTCTRPETYALHVTIFGRPVSGSPYAIEVSDQHNPIAILGGVDGDGKIQLSQPVKVAVGNQDDVIYVLDTGNDRLKVFQPDLTPAGSVECRALMGHSATGLAVCPVSGNLVICNWRTKKITELTTQGSELTELSHPDLLEPTDVAVNATGEVFVLDSGFVVTFDLNCFKGNSPKKKLPPFGNGKVMCIATGPDDTLVAAGAAGIQIFKKGCLHRQISPAALSVPGASKKGVYGGIHVTSDRRILLSRTGAKNFISVIDFDSGKLLFNIESPTSKLRRPAGLASMKSSTGELLVADLGNNAIKKYRYK